MADGRNQSGGKRQERQRQGQVRQEGRQREVPVGRVEGAFDGLDDLADQLAPRRPRAPMHELVLEVARKLSATALP
jgi:hypothetical protein